METFEIIEKSFFFNSFSHPSPAFSRVLRGPGGGVFKQTTNLERTNLEKTNFRFFDDLMISVFFRPPGVLRSTITLDVHLNMHGVPRPSGRSDGSSGPTNRCHFSERWNRLISFEIQADLAKQKKSEFGPDRLF